MSREGKRWFSAVPLFDPTAGITVLEPLSSGSGWWVGAPSILFDSDSQKFYLYYRRRKPRELGRGTYCAIAESSDGISFAKRKIWIHLRLRNHRFVSPWMEKRICTSVMWIRRLASGE